MIRRLRRIGVDRETKAETETIPCRTAVGVMNVRPRVGFDGRSWRKMMRVAMGRCKSSPGHHSE